MQLSIQNDSADQNTAEQLRLNLPDSQDTLGERNIEDFNSGRKIQIDSCIDTQIDREKHIDRQEEIKTEFRRFSRHTG